MLGYPCHRPLPSREIESHRECPKPVGNVPAHLHILFSAYLHVNTQNAPLIQARAPGRHLPSSGVGNLGVPPGQCVCSRASLNWVRVALLVVMVPLIESS